MSQVSTRPVAHVAHMVGASHMMNARTPSSPTARYATRFYAVNLMTQEQWLSVPAATVPFP